jgi:hypothetical protein
MYSVLKNSAKIMLLCGILATPFTASAHERHVFEIKGRQYEVVVGSLGEPLVVDDKSGVDLRVSTLPGNKPVEGLQETLKVELIAGDKKKELPFETVYGTAGAYKAPFFPTVATTLSYRVFGTIEDTPFNVTFTCQSGGHSQATEDTSRTAISDGVVRTLKTGSFGCPEPKPELGFPEESVELRTLSADGPRNGLATAAIALSVIALALTMRRRQ